MFIRKNLTSIGGNSRSGLSSMAWGYKNVGDTLAEAQATGYFDEVYLQMQPGQFINCDLSDGKFVLTVFSTSLILRNVVIDGDVFRPGGAAAGGRSILSVEWFHDTLAGPNDNKPLLGFARDINTLIQSDDLILAEKRICVGARFAADVTAFTSGGTLEVSGDSVDPVTGVTIIGDTENVEITGTGLFLTDKHWNVCTGFVTNAVNFAYTASVFYLDFWRNAENPYTLDGFHGRVHSLGSAMDVRLRIIACKALGNKKYILHNLEDLTWVNIMGAIVNPRAQIIDKLRTGGADRSYDYDDTGTNPFTTVRPEVWHQEDYSTFFTANENVFDPTIGEGVHIFLTDEANTDDNNPNPPNQLDLLNLQLFLDN